MLVGRLGSNLFLGTFSECRKDRLGALSSIKYVVRVDTAGGIDPAEPPTASDQTAKVAYHATYLFLTGG